MHSDVYGADIERCRYRCRVSTMSERRGGGAREEER
jgi:hypothetical protein